MEELEITKYVPGGHFEKSLGDLLPNLTSCGPGTVILFLMLVLSVLLNIYLTKRNTDTVRMVLRAVLKKEVSDDEAD